MSKLILLEWKKAKQNMIFMELAFYIIIIMFLPVFFIKVVNGAFGQSFDIFIELIKSMELSFALFGASLINHVFIEEYKNKTMSLSYSYPISRKKLFSAKILFIALFVFLVTVLSFLLTGITTVILDQFFDVIQFQVTGSDIIAYLGATIFRSIIVSIVSFIPLFMFGVWRRATVPTVTCAIFAMQLPNFSEMFNLDRDFVIFALVLLGAVSLFLAIKTADTVGEI
ncbi:ABC transporter permease [Fredinandcohnia humi]